MKTISIKGIGKAKRDPDLVIFKISTSVKSKEYETGISDSNRLVNELKSEFEVLGFQKEDLKTVRFYTRSIYDYVDVGLVNKRRKKQFEFFEVLHDLKIEFVIDNDKINEVMRCLKKFENIDFDINFSIMNKDAMKRDVILDATRNARFNAEILAEASSVELGDLIKIEYDWIDFNFNSIMDYDCMISSSDCDEYMEFNPDSIEISDTVAFIWEIK